MRPTNDSIYLAGRINEQWHSHSLTPSALQRFVNLYGAEALESGLRELYGFPPAEAIRSPYAYLDVILKENLSAPPEPPQGALW